VTRHFGLHGEKAAVPGCTSVFIGALPEKMPGSAAISRSPLHFSAPGGFRAMGSPDAPSMQTLPGQKSLLQNKDSANISLAKSLVNGQEVVNQTDFPPIIVMLFLEKAVLQQSRCLLYDAGIGAAKGRPEPRAPDTLPHRMAHR
jgi:hypothetical protein